MRRLLATIYSGIDETRGVAIAYVPTGETGNIVITTTGTTPTSCFASWWRMVSPKHIPELIDREHINIEGGATSMSATISIKQGGAVVGVYGRVGGGTVTWTNMVERADSVVETSAAASSAELIPNSDGSITVTATSTVSSTFRTLDVVSWR